MKKYFILLIIIGCVLFFTNPDAEDFQNHLANKIENAGENSGNFGEFLGGLFSNSIAKIIKNNTEISNYYLFSIYKINLGDQEAKYLGILGKIFVLKNDFKLKDEQ